MKPTVIVDVALLGWAHEHPSYARGVHRVADRIVTGLIESGACELRFVATSSLSGAIAALSSRWPGIEKKVHCHPGHQHLSRWAGRAFAWVERTLSDRRWSRRAARWLVQRLAVWADEKSGQIPAQALAGADIYHSPLAPIPEIVRRFPGVKRFLTVHDLIPLTRPAVVEGRGVPLLRRRLDSIGEGGFAFCVSESVRHDLVGLCPIAANNVFVSPLAADGNIFHPVEDIGARAAVCARHGLSHQPYFLTLSSFDPRKNFTQAIKSFARAVEKDAVGTANLVIVGSNPERMSAVETAIACQNQLRGRVICPGFIPDEDIAAIYSGATAFLFPSLGEGFGMPPLEAMQCGVPVICSNAAAIPEVVGDAGITLEPNDTESWCAAMRQLWEDSDLRDTLARRGLARSKQFSWARFTEIILHGFAAALAVQPNAQTQSFVSTEKSLCADT